MDDTGGAGVDFPDIPPAVAAATDGDVLLVAPGTYSHFVLAGKSLRILGSGNQSTFVSLPGAAGYTTQVSDVPGGHVVDLHRLNFGAPGLGADRLVVSGATTQVVLADSIVVGRATDGAVPYYSLRVEDAEVQVHRSTVVPMTGSLNTGGLDGGSAMLVRGGDRVHVSSSIVQGGAGGFTGAGVLGAPPGGPAIVVADAVGGVPWLWVAGSTVRGGAGGTDPVFGFYVTGTGGTGIVATNAHVRVSGDSTSLVQGGASPLPSAYGSGPGPGITVSGAYPVEVHSVAVLSGCASSPFCTTPATVGPVVLGAPPLPVLRATGSFSLTADGTLTLSNGPASSLFALALDEGPAHFGIPGPFLGEFVTGPPPAVLLQFGTLDPTGSSSLTVPLAGLPAGLAYVPFHVQGDALDAGGLWRLSNGTVVILRP